MDLRDQLRIVEQGGGQVTRTDDFYRLGRPTIADARYANAELTDRGAWYPPLTLTVRSRFSHSVDRLRGTAGFGFWNTAFTPDLRRLRLPRTVWFFASGPPHDVPLAIGVPGRGFKGAVLDAHRFAFLALLPTAPFGFLAMRHPALYHRLWPVAQRALGVDEVNLATVDLTEAHDYTIDWGTDQVQFSVDRQIRLTTRAAPGGPLSFVAWIDNAFAIATPRGHFDIGVVNVDEPQWLEIGAINLEARGAFQ